MTWIFIKKKKKKSRYKILTNHKAALKFKPILLDVLCVVIGYIWDTG